MGVLALALIAVLFGLGIGVRGWRHRRRYGSDVLRAALQRRPGTKAWLVGQLTGVGFGLLTLAAVLTVSGTVVAPRGLRSTGADVAGAVVFTAGFLLSQRAASEMDEWWRVSVDPSERVRLVTSGTFSAVRNPIYVGLMVAMLGIVVLVPTPAAAAGWLTLVLSLELQVRVLEEPYLRGLDEQRDAYAERVGRFVPGVGRRNPR